jgi:magnesium-transporting ATPase (P-type)
MSVFPTDLTLVTSTSPENISSVFETDFLKGLSTSECKIRLRKNGLNVITPHKKVAEWKNILRHFKSPLIILLLLATAISYSVGETFNASIIFIIVLSSVLIDFFQERNAEMLQKSLETL